MADYVARYENYDQEVRSICTRLGLTIDAIPKMHHTPGGHWPEILRGEVLDRCISYHSLDFCQLGYSR